MIHFEFEGRKYSVGMAAYGWDRIQLPGGRVLCVLGWDEGDPPTPRELREMSSADWMALQHAGHIGPMGAWATEL